MRIKYFKIIPFYFKNEDGKSFFYAIKRRRWFLFVPYWSFRVYNTSNDYAFAELISEAQEIKQVLEANRVTLIDKIKRIWQ